MNSTEPAGLHHLPKCRPRAWVENYYGQPDQTLRSSETSPSMYQSTRCNISKQNLESYILQHACLIFFTFTAIYYYFWVLLCITINISTVFVLLEVQQKLANCFIMSVCLSGWKQVGSH